MLSPQQFSTLTGFPNFLLLQGIEKSDFSGHQFGVQKTLAKTGPATEGLPSSRTCVAINVRRAWRTSACGAAKPWKSSGMENFCRVPAETIEPLAIFRPVTLKFLPTKRPPVLGSKNGPQNGGHSFSLNLICLCPDDLAPVLGSRKRTPKRRPFVGKIFAVGRK